MRRNWIWMVCGGLAATLASAALTVAGCGGDETDGDGSPAEPPTTSLEVTVTFGSELAKTSTTALHMWALVPVESSSEADAVTCSSLVGGEHEPYDLALDRLADVVELDIDAKIVAEEVELGMALVYVEGVSFSGRSELAGCTEVELSEPNTTASVTLTTAGVFDCADPATEDGDPCDDGLFCTVGDTCDGGTCESGAPRDCTHLADDCNAEACSEEVGCSASPVPDGTPCEDGLTCTQGDVCSAGECVGGGNDCEALTPDCQESLGCSEQMGCLYGPLPDGTPCDDGAFCTEDDTCQLGTCSPGTDMDCRVTQCLGVCDEVADACDPTAPLPASTPCDNLCTATSFDSCDGAGQCGLPADENCSGSDVDECNLGECTETGLTIDCETVIQNGATCQTTGTCDAAGICQGGT